MCVSFHAVHPRSRARAVRGRDAHGRSHRAGVRVCTGHQCVRVLMCTRAQHALLARRVRATRPPPRRVRYAFALHATHSLGALLTFCCPCPLSSHQRCRPRQVHQPASENASASVLPPYHRPPTFLLQCPPPTLARVDFAPLGSYIFSHLRYVLYCPFFPILDRKLA